MREYPGYQPWHIAGDPWFTHKELAAIRDDLQAVMKARAERARKAKANQARPLRPQRGLTRRRR